MEDFTIDAIMAKLSPKRGFERLSCIKHDFPMPKRGSLFSAGYDICVIHPKVFEMMKEGMTIGSAWDLLKDREKFVCKASGVKLPTGIKAYMMPDEYLQIHIRSSVGIKQGICLKNTTGIIDSDYYNNPDNEGHILIALNVPIFEFKEPMERICQGIFTKYLVTDNDSVCDKRKGGIGSTDED
jgi:dUTP pyrophosphatase